MNKKHRFKWLVIILIIGLIFILGIMILGSSGSDSEESTEGKTEISSNETADTENAHAAASGSAALDQTLEKLSGSGSSLAPDYPGGEYGSWGTEQQIENLRDYYTDTADAGTVTWMVYMVGSDLESESKAASADLAEMLDADCGDNLNLVVETGGASAWHTKKISADTRGRWLIRDHELTAVGDAGQGSMCTQESLADFIAWTKKNYPADRYVLELWDHGGGTMGGFGSDENYPEDVLSLADISAAVEKSGIKLDVISFDACLMGTLEAANCFEPYADYLLASEETEPGDGWAYTDTLTALSENPSMPTVELGARLIDAYGAYYGNDDVTLSLIDLREIPNLYAAYTDYSGNAQQVITSSQGFQQISRARENSRAYADGQDEQIDLADYVRQTSMEGGEELLQLIFSAVKYRNNSDLTGSYGMAVYFPYTQPELYEDVRQELQEIDCTGAEGFYNDFLSVLTSADGGNADTLTQVTGYSENTTDLTQEDWYTEASSQNYNYDTLEGSDDLALNYDEAAESYTLALSPDTWDQIADAQLRVLLDDGEGYIDLGSDQVLEFTDNDTMKVDFNNSWMALNGQAVEYYAFAPETAGDRTIYTGIVPAVLNGEEKINIYLSQQFEADGSSTASVLGYLPVTEDGNTYAKGYFTLQSGDVIQPTCDYYTYDGDYDDSYTFGDEIVVDSQDALTVDTCDLEEASTLIWVKLTDLYQQDWYTESVTISFSAQ